MKSKHPALWENGQYLEEWDPSNPNTYSEAACKAQAAVYVFLGTHSQSPDIACRNCNV